MSKIRKRIYDPDILPPSAPSGLVAAVIPGAAIELTCLPAADAPAPPNGVSSGVAKYRWSWGVAASSLVNTLPDTALPTTTHAGRTLGVEYFYAVAAVDAAGNIGPRSATVSATVPATNDPPLLNFSLAPLSIFEGASILLTWSTTNAATVIASGAWSGNKALSGQQVLFPATSSTYVLTALNASGASTAQARTVTVNGVPPPPVSDGKFAFGELPVIAAVEGEPDSFFLGQFCLDPKNPPQPGDVFTSDEDQPYWQRGFNARPRRPDGAVWAPAPNRIVTVAGDLPPGWAWDANTGILSYDGTMLGPSDRLAEALVRLQLDTSTGLVFSDVMTVRTLRPTHVYGADPAPLIAAKWPAAEYSVRPVPVFTQQQLLSTATRTGGTTAAAPLVVYMPDSEYPGQVGIDLDARAPVNGAGSPLTPAPVFANITNANPAVMEFTNPHGLANTDIIATTDAGSFVYVPKTFLLTNTGGGFSYDVLEADKVSEVALRVISPTQCEIYLDKASKAKDGRLNNPEVPWDTTGYAPYADGPYSQGRYLVNYQKSIGFGSSGTFKYVFGKPFARNRIKHRFILSFGFNQPPTTEVAQVFSYWRHLDLYGPIDVTGTCKTSVKNAFGLPDIQVYSSASIYGVHDRDDWQSRASDGWASDGGDGSLLEPHPAGYSGNSSVRTGLPLRITERQLDYHWDLEITNWMGAAGTKHPFYLHGRPEGYFYTSNIWFHGNPDSIVLKTTRYNVRHRNHMMWSHRSVYDPVKRQQGQNAPAKYINFNQNADAVVYNCKFVTWRNAPYEYNGNNYNYTRIPECIWLDGRRTLWGGNDGPPYPDIWLRSYVVDPRPVQFVFGGSGVKNTPGALVPGLAFYVQPADRVTYAPTGPAVAMPPTQTLTSLNDATVGIYSTTPTETKNGWLVSMAVSDFAPGLYRCWIGATATPDGALSKAEIAYMDVYKDDDVLAVTGCVPWPDTARLGNYGQDKYVWDQMTGRSAYFSLAGVNDDGTLGPYATDPANPYTDKAFITNCEWVWLRGAGEDSGNQHGPIVCEGTIPSSALGQFSKGNVFGPVPSNWHHAACVFVANPTLRGWTLDDLTDLSDSQYKRNFQWRVSGPGTKTCTDDADLALANNDTYNLMLPGYERYYGPDLNNIRTTLPDVPYRSVVGTPGALPHEGLDGLNVYEHDGTPVITNTAADLPDWWKI